MTQETKSFHSLCQDVEEKLGALSSGINLKSVCYEQKHHAARIMTGYVEDEKGTGRPVLDPDAPACLKPNYVESGPSLLEDAAYRKPQEILRAMSECFKIVSHDPEALLGEHRLYVKEKLRLGRGNLRAGANIIENSAFLEAHAASQDEFFSQDMNRFRLGLLTRINNAIPALRESLEDIRNRIVVTGDIPAFDYHNPNHHDPETGKKGRKETLRNIYPDFRPAEDILKDMIKSTRALEKTLDTMIKGFWKSVGDGPKGDGPKRDSPDNKLTNVYHLDKRRGPSDRPRG